MKVVTTGATCLAAGAALAALSALSAAQTPAAAPADALERGFRETPASARPRVWWHWMNGNVTREGITADLEWMKRVGIGGVQQFDANIGNIRAGQWSTPQFVDKRIVYRTPEWKELLRHAASETFRPPPCSTAICGRPRPCLGPRAASRRGSNSSSPSPSAPER